jgi:NAD(P)-dependent dehydrogenase (short-subunit alcohol dehydrogenase family)
MSDLFSITNKCALVTGGSTGIGEMFVRGFVNPGVRVYMVSRISFGR